VGVVGYTQAQHTATTDDLVELCGLVHRAIETTLRDSPDLTADIQLKKDASNWLLIDRKL
jgi:hypothetical protein